MSKQQAEWSNSFKIFWLKKNGYLNKNCRYQSGGIKWTHGSGSESSIGFSVIKDDWGTAEEKAYVRLQYTHGSVEKENMDYKVELTTTPCRYGGKRYWFICPLSKNRMYCGRRVGVLFCIGKWFGCRHCGEIAYAKQMEGGKHRWNGVSVSDIEKAEKEVRRMYYRGKPTRKYRRYLRLSDKFEYGYFMMMKRLGNLYGLKSGKRK